MRNVLTMYLDYITKLKAIIYNRNEFILHTSIYSEKYTTQLERSERSGAQLLYTHQPIVQALNMPLFGQRRYVKGDYVM